MSGGSIDWEKVEASPVRCADAVAESQMIAAIDAAREEGGSVGRLFEVVASGVLIGLGLISSGTADSNRGRLLASVNLRTGKKVSVHFERADTCIVHAAGVIGEAMLAIVLAEAFLEKLGGEPYRSEIIKTTASKSH